MKEKICIDLAEKDLFGEGLVGDTTHEGTHLAFIINLHNKRLCVTINGEGDNSFPRSRPLTR